MTAFDAGVPAQAKLPARQTVERIGIHRITLFIVGPRACLRKPIAGVTRCLQRLGMQWRRGEIVTSWRREALAPRGEAARTRCSNVICGGAELTSRALNEIASPRNGQDDFLRDAYGAEELAVSSLRKGPPWLAITSWFFPTCTSAAI